MENDLQARLARPGAYLPLGNAPCTWHSGGPIRPAPRVHTAGSLLLQIHVEEFAPEVLRHSVRIEAHAVAHEMNAHVVDVTVQQIKRI
jgi:hypothetical protein